MEMAMNLQALLPITVIVQRSRGFKTRELLHIRQERERQYVSVLADIIDNTHAFRGPPMSWIRTVFNERTAAHAKAVIEVRNFALTTAAHVERVQGVLASSLFFIGTIPVDRGVLTPGVCLGIIIAFGRGSADILSLTNIFLRLKFCCEGLRNISRIVCASSYVHMHTFVPACIHTVLTYASYVLHICILLYT
jgi:ABC-type bacteriocin/lantibiotic exporter with double-glycine peptidase domain